MQNPLRTSVLNIAAALVLNACTSSEIGNSKDVNPETIYSDYSVNYTEGEDSISCYLQYRFAGEMGTTLVLSGPSKVSIDGNEIMVDSGSVSGAYYEKKFSAGSFNGEHLIAFTDINGKKQEEKFAFNRIACITKIPASINKENLVFEFNGATNSDNIDVTVSDTSSATEDIHVSNKLNNNKFTLTAAQLKNLSAGPIEISIYKNVSMPLQQPTKQGGKFSINYFIKETNTQLKN